jgi:hypothetical protein
MKPEDYLDKKIPEEAREPDWHNSEYQRDTEKMHRLDAEWQEVYQKTMKYLKRLGGNNED